MTIIRSKISQDFTIIQNNVIQDKNFDSKYLGVFLRLISKTENWEISVTGLATLYPTNGIDFYRNALKHMCKLGYLVRIPQPKKKGQFQKVIMELYDEKQIDDPLSDEDVEKLFSKEQPTIEEIQKIYPKRVFQHGFSCEGNPTQRNTIDERTINNDCSVSDEDFLSLEDSIQYTNNRGESVTVDKSEIMDSLKIYEENIMSQVFTVLENTDSKISDIFKYAKKIAENLKKKTTRRNKNDSNKGKDISGKSSQRTGFFVNGKRVYQ